ncbi:MAG: zinc ribbon domain-containing protein [Lentisphaeria bacterium]|jgi:putative FmdB family regulatory protein|nr:zinc ribbon domain-containing protein [Lentisphaeria bacterium]MDP7742340.1 zinc ribbon domain-containing protein [Lentisphaeria bacterium]
MPTYEYKCTKCKHQFEAVQKMTDKPLTRCPECRCKIKRLIGAGAGVIFKGSGFYTTDYRSDSYKKGAQSEKKSSGDDSTSSGEDKGSGDSKPKKDSGKSSPDGGDSPGKKKTAE